MASRLVRGSIKYLYQGVSQQDAFRRREGQAEEIINCRCSMAEGMTSRAGTEHIHTFTRAVTGVPYTTQFKWGLEEKLFHMILDNSGLTLVDAQDQVHTVDTSAVTTYLQAANPRTAFMITHFKDKIYILNREKTVTMTADTAPAQGRNTLIYAPHLTYGQSYELFIDGVSKGTYDAPDYANPPINSDPGVNDPAEVINTDADPEPLMSWLNTELAAAGVSGIARSGVAHVLATTTDKVITITDPSHRRDVRVWQNNVRYRSDLPANCEDGMYQLYTGTDEDEYTDYWLKFEADDPNVQLGTGKWVEAAAPGSPIKLDGSTLPVVLYLDGGVWKLRLETWAERKTGNNNLNELPSFVDAEINWIGSMQNRLIALNNKGNFLASQPMIDVAKENPNWFATTMRQALPTDPIDIFAAGPVSPELIHAEMASDFLIITGRSSQFVLSGKEALHNGNIRLVQSSAVSCSATVAPVATATDLMFLAPKGKRGYTQITRYQVYADRRRPETQVITKHVPSYIKGTPVQMAADPTNQLLYVLPEDGRKIYVYEYHIDDGKLMQAAWHTWTFGKKVLSMAVLDGRLHLLTQDLQGTAMNIEAMDLTGSPKDPDFWNSPALDSQQEFTPEIEAGQWVVKVPYVMDAGTLPLVVVADGWKDDKPIVRAPGVRLEATFKDANTLVLPQMTTLIPAGDGALVRLTIGYSYDSEYHPTMPYPRDRAGDTYIPTNLLYQTWKIHYLRSADMTIEIEHDSLPTVVQEKTSFVIGSPESKLGRPPIADGQHLISVGAVLGKCQLKVTRRQTHMPFAISHLDWNGRVIVRGRIV